MRVHTIADGVGDRNGKRNSNFDGYSYTQRHARMEMAQPPAAGQRPMGRVG